MRKIYFKILLLMALLFWFIQNSFAIDFLDTTISWDRYVFQDDWNVRYLPSWGSWQTLTINWDLHLNEVTSSWQNYMLMSPNVSDKSLKVIWDKIFMYWGDYTSWSNKTYWGGGFLYVFDTSANNYSCTFSLYWISRLKNADIKLIDGKYYLMPGLIYNETLSSSSTWNYNGSRVYEINLSDCSYDTWTMDYASASYIVSDTLIDNRYLLIWWDFTYDDCTRCSSYEGNIVWKYRLYDTINNDWLYSWQNLPELDFKYFSSKDLPLVFTYNWEIYYKPKYEYDHPNSRFGSSSGTENSKRSAKYYKYNPINNSVTLFTSSWIKFLDNTNLESIWTTLYSIWSEASFWSYWYSDSSDDMSWIYAINTSTLNSATKVSPTLNWYTSSNYLLSSGTNIVCTDWIDNLVFFDWSFWVYNKTNNTLTNITSNLTSNYWGSDLISWVASYSPVITNSNKCRYEWNNKFSFLDWWNSSKKFTIDISDYSVVKEDIDSKELYYHSKYIGILDNVAYSFWYDPNWNYNYWPLWISEETSSWRNYSEYVLSVVSTTLNYAPTIASISSDNSYINISNVNSFPFDINNISDTDSDQTITYLFSTDWTNYSSIWTSSSPVNLTKYSFSEDLSWLLDWTKSFYLKANDWIVDSNIVSVFIDKDTVAPTISEVTPISTYINDSTPDYTFSSTENWGIWYTNCLSSTLSAVSWNNTITLNSLIDWIYNNCKIKVTDTAWNSSSDLTISTFNVDTVAPVSPSNVTYNSGSSYSQSRTISISLTHSNESDVDEWCVVNWNETISDCSWTWTKPTSFTFSSDWTKTLKFYVKDLAGNTNSYSPITTILVDTVNPVINITTDVDSSYSNTWKTIVANLTESNINTFGYVVVDNSVTCDSSLNYTSYTSWSNINLNSENYNWKKICFEAMDLAQRTDYNSSSQIQNIDMTVPNNPNYSSAYQSGWNKVSFSGSCNYENWLSFVVVDNWTEIARETLTSSCNIDYTYTLSDSVVTHNIDYYLEDLASNKSTVKSFIAYVDSSWVLITPKSWKTVWPLITFFWYASPNTNVSVINTSDSSEIASWNTDNNGTFTIETTTSQALWSLTIDLVVNSVPKSEPRTITVDSESIIVPEIDEETIYSKYSWIKDIYSFEAQVISFLATWEALSYYKVYSYADVNWERVITEIAEWQFDSDWEANISSNVALPGWDNEIIIIDTVHEVSSNIIYMVISDPFWIVYDSVTKEPIVWAEISFCLEWETELATFPFLHWEPQPNPVVTDSNWRYFSYHEVWTKLYYCKVEAEWYTFPSTIVASWNNNLDNTPNIWSHGQVFEIIATPLHIDIPLDPVKQISWWWAGWGWISNYGYIYNYKDEKNVSSNWNRILTVYSEKWTKSLDKTYYRIFNWWVYSNDVYEVLYDKWLNKKYYSWINVDKALTINITDLDLPSNFKVYIKYDEEKEYKLFNDYTLNWKTISFETLRWFKLYIDKSEEEIAKVSEDIIEKSYPEYDFYEVKYYLDIDPYTSIITYNNWNKKYLDKFEKLSNDIILTKFPKAFKKIDSMKNPSGNYKIAYNYLWKIYNNRIKTIQ